MRPPGLPSVGPNAETESWLLKRGYALAGSAGTGRGWVVHDAVVSNLALLDAMAVRYGHTKRVVAWGGSFGAMVAAALMEAAPQRIAGAFTMCGAVMNPLVFLDTEMDGAFALTRSIASLQRLRLDGTDDVQGAQAVLRSAVSQAQATPQGRARLSLAAAVMDFSGWIPPQSSEPVDPEAIERGQETALADFVYGFLAVQARTRTALNANPVGNEDISYRRLLQASRYRSEVVAMYERAGLSRDGDLIRLDSMPRIHADTQAIEELRRWHTFTGRLSAPFLMLESTGDDWLVEAHREYADLVRRAGREQLLRQLWVKRAGHCPFTGPEVQAALSTLIERLDSDGWDSSPMFSDFMPDRLPRAVLAG